MKNIIDFINENNGDGFAVVAILSGSAGNFSVKSTYTNDNIENNEKHPGASIEDNLEDLLNIDFDDVIDYDYQQLSKNEASKWIKERSRELMQSAKNKYKNR